MNKYDKILEEMKETNVNIVKLYIYDIVGREDITEAVYSEWVDIEGDFSLARLTDIINDNWKEYQAEEFTTEDIIDELFI